MGDFRFVSNTISNYNWENVRGRYLAGLVKLPVRTRVESV
jgi:hypothetical protein